MVDQTELLRYAVQNLERVRVRYAIVGSFASGVWGESRLTQDIDIVVDLKPSDVDSICAAFPDPEFYLSRPAAQEAVTRSGQFNVINPSSGNKIDFMVAGTTKWVLAQLDRSKQVPVFSDQSANVAAPEDVILGKLIYYREGGSEKHLRDIRGMLKFSGDTIDLEYMNTSSRHLGVRDMWEAILNADR